MSDVQQYAVIDGAGNIVNIVAWDGTTSWQPPAGCTTVQSDTYAIGGTYINGTYTAPIATAPSQNT